MVVVSRALISVFNKTGIVDCAKGLAKWEPEVLSTGGTAGLIAGAGVPVREISDFTGFPELFDGRLKTIHPKVAGGLLYMRHSAEHAEQALANQIYPIDLLVVNFYDFETETKKTGATFWDILEKVDIGGPSMIRAAAKNFRDVVVVTSPDDYAGVLQEMERNNGGISYETCFRLMQAAFKYTAKYEAKIDEYMQAVYEIPALS